MTDALLRALEAHPRLLVLTGAGISAESGIPTYRNDRGEWQRSNPILHQEFVRDEACRRRYWARSMNGWPFVREARPNGCHRHLATLEERGRVSLLVTQNVDRLHQRAGSRSVVDLHGRLDRVRCLDCRQPLEREALQQRLKALNPDYADHRAAIRPDGDAEVDERWLAHFQTPPCAHCGGVLMPDVVFFGGTVPKARVEQVQTALAESDAMLVVGSSLQVFSGFRFCRQAVEAGKPLFIINRGDTRADPLATVKVSAPAAGVLASLLGVEEADGRVA